MNFRFSMYDGFFSSNGFGWNSCNFSRSADDLIVLNWSWSLIDLCLISWGLICAYCLVSIDGWGHVGWNITISKCYFCCWWGLTYYVGCSVCTWCNNWFNIYIWSCIVEVCTGWSGYACCLVAYFTSCFVWAVNLIIGGPDNISFTICIIWCADLISRDIAEVIWTGLLINVRGRIGGLAVFAAESNFIGWTHLEFGWN